MGQVSYARLSSALANADKAGDVGAARELANELKRYNSEAPTLYDDPRWDGIEAAAAAKHSVPVEVMKAVRTAGERSNGNQVSGMGASGVYQFIPGTRDAFLKKYGVDAYGTPEQQAEAAALHLKEGYERTKDWTKAMAGYNGGISGEKGTNTTAENKGYVERTTQAVGGQLPKANRRDSVVQRATGAAQEVIDNRTPTVAAPAEPVAEPAPAPIEQSDAETKRLLSNPKLAVGSKPEGVLGKAKRYATDVAAGVGQSVMGAGQQALAAFPAAKLASIATQTHAPELAQQVQQGAGAVEQAYQQAGPLATVAKVGTDIATQGGVPAGEGFLQRTGVNAVQGGASGFSEPVGPGETRGGNTVKGALGAIVGGEGGRKLMQGANRIFRGPEAQEAMRAVNYLRKKLGGNVDEAVDAIRPSASGVPLTPAAASGNPKLVEIEQRLRGQSPEGWAGIDTAADQFGAKRLSEITEEAAGRRADIGADFATKSDALKAEAARRTAESLRKVRVNDTHRKDIQEGLVNKLKASPEIKGDPAFQKQLDDLMGTYGKGGGYKSLGQMREEFEALINSNTRISADKKARLMKESEQYFGPQGKSFSADDSVASLTGQRDTMLGDVASNQAASTSLVKKDLARAQSTRTPLESQQRNVPEAAWEAGKTLLNFKRAKMTGGLFGIPDMAKSAKATYQALRHNVPPKELQEAMKSEEALKAMIRKYDKVSSDEKVRMTAAALMGRGTGEYATER